MPELDVEIDGLTQSVVIARTGRSLQTRIVDWSDLAPMQLDLVSDWQFDWRSESMSESRQVAALLVAHSEAVEGLMSCERRLDHVHVHLIESAPHNIGAAKRYNGVPANLMAYACRESGRLGFDGVVVFDSKTDLINHYMETLGAIRLGRSNRMVLNEEAAKSLIARYFKDGDQWR